MVDICANNLFFVLYFKNFGTAKVRKDFDRFALDFGRLEEIVNPTRVLSPRRVYDQEIFPQLACPFCFVFRCWRIRLFFASES